jgi:Domain of Unknown Function (DUF349)
MGLLDRLKPPPRWKHPDPQVRLAGVQEIPEDEQDILASIAREDEDGRVRRAAVSRLGNVAVLTDVVGRDADESVRDEAAGVLLDIAVGVYEAQEPASLAAVDGLATMPPMNAQKQLVLVAKTAQRESVSLAALALVSGDERALGTIARRAEHQGVRAAALSRLSDAGELAATALKSEYRDAAVGALERVTDREALRSIAARAKNQAAARRAKALVRSLEEREAAEVARETARLEAVELRRRAQRDLCRDVEVLLASPDWSLVTERLAAAEARWESLGSDVEPDLVRRFGEAAAAVRDGLVKRDAERAEELAEQERQASELAARLAVRIELCERLEALGEDAAASDLDPVIAAWEALPSESGAAAVAARFDQARRAIERRRRQSEGAAARRVQLTALCEQAEHLVEQPAFAAARDLRAEWTRLRQEWTRMSGTNDQADADLMERFRATEARAEVRESESREARTREERALLARAERTAATVEALAQDEAATLKAVERALSDSLAVESSLSAHRGAGAAELLARVQAGRLALQPKAQVLREADDWQRWLNAEAQEQLAVQMEALQQEADPQTALRRMRELQASWQRVATAPRERAQSLWRRFRTAQDALRAKVEPHIAAQAAAQTEHLAHKLALCERAEALAASSDWIATATAIKALQAEWKTVGPAPRRDEQRLWERFRRACNEFFTRRQSDLAQRKEQWTANLARKDALCVEAEALSASSDWEPALARIKAMQAEWRSIGPVRKNKSEAIWQRFRTACDALFERYRQRDTAALAARVGTREQLCADMEALSSLAADPAGRPADLLQRIRSLRAGWQQAGPLPREVAKTLGARFDRALCAVVVAAPDVVRHTEIDIEGNRRQLEQLCEKVERLAGREVAPANAVSPAALLAHQLREALAANTIGGRVDDEARWKTAEHDVRAAQDAWRRIGFVPEEVQASLGARFQRACQRFFDQRHRRSAAPEGRRP